MIVRWLIAVITGGVLLVGGELRAASVSEAILVKPATLSAFPTASPPIIDEIVFVGLRHIAPAAVQAQISSRAADPLDVRRIESDVKALGRLGWFDDIRVEAQPAQQSALTLIGTLQRVRVIFYIHELPHLAKVEFVGSQLLSVAQIHKLLEGKRQNPHLGEPATPASLQRIGQTIREALAELGHPQPEVRIHRVEFANCSVSVCFVISDGPHLPVGRIDFEGNIAITQKVLRREMPRTAPGAFFASLRGKSAYTRDGFEEDRSRMLIYFQNNGFPEARIGTPRISVYENASRRWTLWPFRKTGMRLAVSVPVEAGPFYRVASVDVSSELVAAGMKHGPKLPALSKAQVGSAYSAKATEDLRHLWVVAIQPKHGREVASPLRSVESSRMFDQEAHEVQVCIGFSDAQPYIVRRIEFRGLHRFSDRYLRRRIGLQEGEAFEERALEIGLARIAKTGYFHTIRKEDIHVLTNDISHTADVTIQVAEAGTQHAAFSGGLGQFGSTLGLAYSLFDLLQRDELISAQFDGGPETLQIVLGLVLEGFLGSRDSLAISLFDNVLRPRFASSAKGPFYSSESEGLHTGWRYPLTNTDSLTVSYSLTHTNTVYSSLPASITDLSSADLRARTSSSAVGFSWTHDTASERLLIENSVSGGMLGGTESMLRSNEVYARIMPDPLFSHRNAWAFRTIFSGAGSYQGVMPLYALLFSGNAQVRGLSPGQLGPYAEVPSLTASGNQTYSAVPAGANIVTAANAEYRIPMGRSVRAACFFDLGSGWLIPNWMGKSRPTLLDSTNGILHGSLGIELTWTVPEIQVPVRAYYAVNVLRLSRFYQLADGSLFHAHNPLFAFGWALGTLF
jgi:outer membrane protein assembly complex protein YaeT